MEVYLDNAATSWPKPPAVIAAMRRFQEKIGASAGRGAYPRAAAAGRLLDETRSRLTRLLGAKRPERILFTLNASDALNLAIKGISWGRGDTAIVSPVEHNSVMRPLHALARARGIRILRLPSDANGRVDPEDLRRVLRRTRRVRLAAIQHASNVLGTIQPIMDLARVARRAGVPLLVDAAQTAGAYPLDVGRLGIDLLAAPGHKSLLGPLGTGLLYVRPGVELSTTREGGTGSRSEEEIQPDFYPDRMEAGSHNLIGLAGLLAAAAWLLARGVACVRAREEALVARLLEGLAEIPRLRILGPREASARAALVSFTMAGKSPEALARALYRARRVCARAGLHCAPGAHRVAGTYPAGAVRFSVSPATMWSEIEAALEALRCLR